MNAEKIREVVQHKPFRSFRVVMTDGEEIVVSKPRKSFVSGDDLVMVGVCRRNGPGVEKFRLVCTERVQSAEFLAELQGDRDGNSSE
jgi:hypothetical protein